MRDHIEDFTSISEGCIPTDWHELHFQSVQQKGDALKREANKGA